MASPISKRHSWWKWWVCGLLLMATMINYMDRLTINLTAPRIKQELLLSNEQYGRIEGVFGIAFAIGALIFGWSVDRWNVRWVYAGALFAWSAAGFASGLAHSFAGLLLCRFLLGLFEAGNWPCALRTTQHILTREERTLGNSILQSGAALGAIIIPLVAQFFVAGNGSRWIPGILAADTNQFVPQSALLMGSAPQAGFPGVLPWAGLFLSNRSGTWRYPFYVVGALGTLWVIGWLVSVGKRDLAFGGPNGTELGLPVSGGEGKNSFGRIFVDPRFWVLIVVVITINLTWHFFRVWLPLFLRERHSYGEKEVNYFISAYYIATDAGSLAAGFATLYLARHRMTVHQSRVIVFLFCSLLMLLSIAVRSMSSGMLLLGVLLVIGFGALGVFPVYYSLSQDLTVRHQGKLTGILGCTTWLATATMHPFVGRWLDQTQDYGSVVALAGIFPMIGFFALAFFWKHGSRTLSKQ